VLVWINGPFGGGKTQTAHELRRRLPGSVICDPELLGFGLQRMTPAALRGDFQDLPTWRRGVFDVLDDALRRFDGTLTVPMTLVEPAYFHAIVGRLRRAGHLVHHVALLAERGAVLQRLRGRAVGHGLQRLAPQEWTPRRESFAVAQLDRCLAGLRAPMFAHHIATDHLSVPQVAEHVAAAAGLDLLSNEDGVVRQRLREVWVGLRHLRLD
jgi:hypothetical protein